MRRRSRDPQRGDGRHFLQYIDMILNLKSVLGVCIVLRMRAVRGVFREIVATRSIIRRNGKKQGNEKPRRTVSTLSVEILRNRITALR